MSIIENAETAADIGMQGGNKKYYGVYPAIVTDIRDPENISRVKVSIPVLDVDDTGLQYALWARFATLMAGHDRGFYFLPDVDDEVLVCFEAGDPLHPYIIGSLWNGRDNPPVSMDGAGSNAKKAIVSRNGICIEMIDKNGMESCRIETPGGQKLEVRDTEGGAIEIKTSSGSSITMKSDGSVIINTAKKMTLSGSSVQISAGSVDISSAMVKVSGTIKCDTVIAENVIGSSYSPGAGNIM